MKVRTDKKSLLAALVLLDTQGTYVDGALDHAWTLPEGAVATLSAVMDLKKLGLALSEPGTLFTYFKITADGKALLTQMAKLIGD